MEDSRNSPTGETAVLTSADDHHDAGELSNVADYGSAGYGNADAGHASPIEKDHCPDVTEATENSAHSPRSEGSADHKSSGNSRRREHDDSLGERERIC